MSFEEEFDKTEKERGGGSTSEFYKFVIGENIMRIMSEPVKKESRFGEGYGICYPGAPYCDPVQLQKEFEDKVKEYDEKVKQAKANGEDPKRIKKPSRPNTNVKWTVWALVRRTISNKTAANPKGITNEINELKIVDLSGTVAEKLLNYKRSEEYAFTGFPMPYDVCVIVKKKDTKGRTWTPKDVEYDLVAARKETPVTDEEKAALEKKVPIQQIIERMQEKQRARYEGTSADDMGTDEAGGGTKIDYPTDEINPDDIPF